MYLVGLTGGIGCGKSTVSAMFHNLGVPFIDTDLMARKVVEPGKKCFRRIRETFGEEVLTADGQLNRKKLGQIIFGNAQKRSQLNAITHPEIAKEIGLHILHYFLRGHQFVIIDSPLLFEAKTWINFVQKIIVVSCAVTLRDLFKNQSEDNLQLSRVMSRDELSEEDAEARISAQMPLEEKRKRADFIIENSTTLENTRERVLQVYKELRDLKTHWKMRGLILISIFLILCLLYFIYYLIISPIFRVIL